MRARRQHGRGKRGHGALWSIIYIDLMTQIMAFFVIVWTIEHGTKATATVNLATGFGMGDQTVRMVDLPGDVLFGSGKTDLAADGKDVIGKLFGDTASGVLNFDRGGMAQRKLVIHGHTDDVGIKDANFQLGYQRAWSVYQEIRRHSKELPDHVILCTHADNTPTSVLPSPTDPKLTDEEKAVIAAARAKNRRITIEDLVTAAPVAKSDATPTPAGGTPGPPPAGTPTPAPPSGTPPAPPSGSSGSQQGAADHRATPHAALPTAPSPGTTSSKTTSPPPTSATTSSRMPTSPTTSSTLPTTPSPTTTSSTTSSSATTSSATTSSATTSSATVSPAWVRRARVVSASTMLGGA